MNQRDFISAVAKDAGLDTAAVERVIKQLPQTLAEALNGGDRVRLNGLGVFEPKANPAREGRNPRTGEAMTIQASRSVKFRPAKPLKDALNGG